MGIHCLQLLSIDMMISEHVDVLIIGSGLMASAFLSGFQSRRITSCNIKICSGLLGTHISHSKFLNNRLHLGSYATHSVTDGGLSKFWHSIIPVKHIKSSYQAQRLFSQWYGLDTNKIIGYPNNVYFVPYKPFRTTILPSQRYLIEDDLVTKVDGSIACFASGKNIRFNKVIFCCGALPAANILRNSGLLKGETYFSDHLNVYLGSSDKPFFSRVYGRNLKGHFKKFYLKNGAMVLERPSFSKQLSMKNPRIRSVFTRSGYGIISKLLSPEGISLVPEAIYNKFGLISYAPRTKYYAQIKATDFIRLSESGLVVDEDRAAHIQEEIKNLVQRLNIENVVEPLEFSSGIHLCFDRRDENLPDHYFYAGGVMNQLDDCLHNSFLNAASAFKLGEKIAQE